MRGPLHMIGLEKVFGLSITKNKATGRCAGAHRAHGEFVVAKAGIDLYRRLPRPRVFLDL